MIDKVSHLSHGALKNIVENQDGTTQYCVQILSIDTTSDMKTKTGPLSLCVCSDGFAKMKIHILNLSPSTSSIISKFKPIIRI